MHIFMVSLRNIKLLQNKVSVLARSEAKKAQYLSVKQNILNHYVYLADCHIKENRFHTYKTNNLSQNAFELYNLGYIFALQEGLGVKVG